MLAFSEYSIDRPRFVIESDVCTTDEAVPNDVVLSEKVLGAFVGGSVELPPIARAKTAVQTSRRPTLAEEIFGPFAQEVLRSFVFVDCVVVVGDGGVRFVSLVGDGDRQRSIGQLRGDHGRAGASNVRSSAAPSAGHDPCRPRPQSRTEIADFGDLGVSGTGVRVGVVVGVVFARRSTDFIAADR